MDEVEVKTVPNDKYHKGWATGALTVTGFMAIFGFLNHVGKINTRISQLEYKISTLEYHIAHPGPDIMAPMPVRIVSE